MNTKLIEKIQSLEAEHENIKKIADAIELYKNNKIDEIDKILTDTSGALNDLNNLKQVEFKKIDDANNIFLKEKNEEIEEIKRAIADLNRQSEITLENADKLVAQATTASLAHSFDEQAIILRKRTFWWSVSLAMALGIAAVISVFKFYVTFTTGNNNIEFNQFLYQAGTSLILISPFIWFSWLATKQIGNLFRLSEDYQFKASVAKSYEGYRKQAASIDREFEKTLFASALKRFDQEPLRHVETHVHGSPVTEFIREWLKGKNVKDEGQIEKLSPVKNQSEE